MINILWDASHIWGYLLLHAVKATGIPFRVLKGLDIAHSGLTGKMLIVPGGSARRKFEALGAQGTEAIHRFVKEGGHYMGFCGGAGLALVIETSIPAVGTAAGIVFSHRIHLLNFGYTDSL